MRFAIPIALLLPGFVIAQTVLPTDILYFKQAPSYCLSFDEDATGGKTEMFADINCDNVLNGSDFYLSTPPTPTPGGSDTELQWNNSGVLDGTDFATVDDVNDELIITGTLDTSAGDLLVEQNFAGQCTGACSQQGLMCIGWVSGQPILYNCDSETFWTRTGAYMTIDQNLAFDVEWNFGGGIFVLPNAATCPPSECDEGGEQSRVCIERNASSGQKLLVCEGTSGWVAAGGGGTGAGSGAPNYTQSFTAQTSVTLTHNLGTKNLIVSCYDTTDIVIGPDSIDIDAADPWDVVVGFTESETGRCVVNGLMNAGRHVETFTAETTVTVTGATHGLGTNMVSVNCYNDSDPRDIVGPDSVTVDDGTNDVVITFFESETGKCVLQ